MKSNINFCVMPECYFDTNLVETIVPPDRIGSLQGYNHKHSCTKVVNEMLGKLNDNFAVGIVDKDKRELSGVSEFEIIIEKHDLRLCKHPNKFHYLIYHPPIEQWILDESQKIGIFLDDDKYKLPTTLKELKQQTKNKNSKNDERFKTLFRDLKTKNATGITLLAEWIKYLKTHPYNAEITKLQQL